VIAAVGTSRHHLAAAGLLALGLGVTACSAPQAVVAPPSQQPEATGPVTPKVNRVVLATVSPATETNDMGNIVAPDMWQLRPMYESLIGVASSRPKTCCPRSRKNIKAAR